MGYFNWKPDAVRVAPRDGSAAHIVDRIRARQLDTVDRLMPAMMVANIICTAGLAMLLYRDHGAWLLWWFGFVILLSLSRLVQSVLANTRPTRRSAPRRATIRMFVQAVISAVCYTIVPVWLLTQTSGLTYTVLVCQLTGTMWAGSLVLATVAPAAIAYIAITGALICLGFLLVSWDVEHLFLVLLFLVGAATSIRSALQQSSLFSANQHQQFDLKHQGDLIGLLLKDYEEQTSDWLWETDAALCMNRPSQRFLQALGQPFDAVAGSGFGMLLANPAIDGNAEALAGLDVCVTNRRSFRDHIVPFATGDGPRWWSLSGRPIVDEAGAFGGYRGVATDVTATKLAEARIAHLAHHDSLTDLPNRSFFCSSLDRVLRAPGGKDQAILSLDLDGFKVVNDRLGHPGGDAFLVEIARRLRAMARSGDTIARFGGDEFIILVEDIALGGGVEALCRRLIHELGLPFDILGETMTVGVSLGVAFAPADGRTTDDLLKNADAALYRAKAAGRGSFRFFEPEMGQRARDRQLLIQDLRTALTRDELVLHYQPFISSATGHVTGYEALIRWHHPRRGMVMPADFIPLAEESGLIGLVGAWAIEAACREAATWPETQRVSVNISAIQFRNHTLPQTILRALTQSSLSPARLEVEVTETSLLEDAEGALHILRQIRAMGVRIALDDFGTGYSSLGYLRRFPFDRIKIDRSFVQQFETQHDSQVIIKAIIDIARGLGMMITAEGVETRGQTEALRRIGCEELQGYRFSRPMPATEIDHGLQAADFAGDPQAFFFKMAQTRVTLGR
ncbi:bifunctional diguanylate cyclase/phosphodiesterase [Beijerinckia sp. L45]|uniref:putative bifunctional diguanylate cyclase/phosphodiesterase n=1 Tax=Beijerinckia sp. L45 TaxID=1641855 RepID=UPI001FEF340A|nr:EAL domain-containing protein [Beijerinckia sp. L45]